MGIISCTICNPSACLEHVCHKLQVTTDPAEADFILAHGTEALGLSDAGDPLIVSLDEIKALLERAVMSGRGAPPMIVANPDFVTVEGTNLRTMPGTLARWYEALGGQVHHLLFCVCLSCLAANNGTFKAQRIAL